MDLLDRLYGRLVDVLDRQPPGTADGLTVADVYQRLVPYRAVRAELGILELAQYEHALLRLLSGERGYMAVQSEEVRTELQRELASPNPILGIYRDYAAASVRPLGDSTAAAPAEPAARPLSAPSPPGRPHGPSADVTEEAPPTARGPAPRSAPPAAPQGAARSPRPCRACGEALPYAEDLRFCPACGSDQEEVACARCGARLDPEWKFCIRCGTPRPGVAPRA